MSIILIFFVIILILMFSISAVYSYMRVRAHKEGCPFGQACLHYDEKKAKEAVSRVSKLIMVNMKNDKEYKKALVEFLKKVEHNKSLST